MCKSVRMWYKWSSPESAVPLKFDCTSSLLLNLWRLRWRPSESLLLSESAGSLDMRRRSCFEWYTYSIDQRNNGKWNYLINFLFEIVRNWNSTGSHSAVQQVHPLYRCNIFVDLHIWHALCPHTRWQIGRAWHSCDKKQTKIDHESCIMAQNYWGPFWEILKIRWVRRTMHESPPLWTCIVLHCTRVQPRSRTLLRRQLHKFWVAGLKNWQSYKVQREGGTAALISKSLKHVKTGGFFFPKKIRFEHRCRTLVSLV